MNNKIKAYVDKLFADKLGEPFIKDAKEELLANLNDKYNDLIAEGKSGDEAYLLVISGIGDVDELFKVKQDDDPVLIKADAVSDKDAAASGKDDKKEESDGKGANDSGGGNSHNDTPEKINIAIKNILERTSLSLLWLVIAGAYLAISLTTGNWTVTLAIFPFGAFLTVLKNYLKTKKENLLYGMLWSTAATVYIFISFVLDVWSWSWLILIFAFAAHQIIKSKLKNKN